MSKKNKGSSSKKSNKNKPVKKAGGPAKKKAVKKTASKKTAVKKLVKKLSLKKSAKPVKAKAKVKTKASSKPKPKILLKKSAPAPKAKKKIVPKKQISKALAKKAEKKTHNGVKHKVAEKEIKKVQVPAKSTEKKSEPAPKKLDSTVSSDALPKPSADGKSGNVLAITNTIPKKEIAAISASKIASISSSITNPVKKIESYSIKPEKEPAGKYEMEFVVRSSPEMLFEFLSTPSGLSEWFCDDVNIRNGIYTFIWDGQLQQARLLKTQDDHLVRFQWVDKTDGSYFEFKIQRDDLTNDISLIITDFAESNSEKESAKLLWQSQVDKLLHIIGSIF